MNKECPCFACLFSESIKARSCKPEECDMLTEWIMEAAKLETCGEDNGASVA